MSKKRKKAIPPVMTLKVGPDRYEVFTGKDVKNDGRRVMGLCFYGQSRIVVSTEYSKPKQRGTLFHEALHAVSDTYDVGLSEKQIRKLEVGLLSLIDDNPELLAWEGV